MGGWHQPPPPPPLYVRGLIYFRFLSMLDSFTFRLAYITVDMF